MLFQPKLLHIVKQDMYMIVKSQEVKKTRNIRIGFVALFCHSDQGTGYLGNLAGIRKGYLL